jgi:hypothetical protein
MPPHTIGQNEIKPGGLIQALGVHLAVAGLKRVLLPDEILRRLKLSSGFSEKYINTPG